MSAVHKGNDIMAASGHVILTSGVGAKWSVDCPKCKYGTMVNIDKNGRDEKDRMRCIDCRAIFTVKKLVDLRVLPASRLENLKGGGA
jgi:transposase-like protein